MTSADRAEPGTDASDELLRVADTALRRAKRLSPGRFLVYSDNRDEFLVHYRPVFRSATGEIHAFEVVWGMDDNIDDRVLEAVCRQAAEWERSGLRPHIAFKVSPAELRRTGFADALGDHVNRALLDPSWFTVEVIESAATAGDDEMRTVLRRLRDIGFRIALDDFSADYSSLARLRDLPVDELKIDRSGAIDMDSLIAGVESQAHLDILVARQCRLAQGFRVAEPLAPEQATLLLRRTPREAPGDRRPAALVAGGR